MDKVGSEPTTQRTPSCTSDGALCSRRPFSHRSIHTRDPPHIDTYAFFASESDDLPFTRVPEAVLLACCCRFGRHGCRPRCLVYETAEPVSS